MPAGATPYASTQALPEDSPAQAYKNVKEQLGKVMGDVKQLGLKV